MASLPETLNMKRAPMVADDSKLDDRSDDDSDINHDGDASKHDKAQDQDAQYTEEANTNYSLFSNPPNLQNIRQSLFDVNEDVEMTAEDFEEYFPFVDNVWRKFKSDQKELDPNTDTFCCRLKPSNQHKTAAPKPHVEGKQTRRKRKREEKICPMLIKVTYIASPVKKVRVSRAVDRGTAHTHDLEYMDQNKRNTAIMDVARREAIRGFLPGSIFWKMQEEPEMMEEAGGRHMKVSDVRNVQYPWRQQNPTVILKAHAGYTQQRTGPRQPKAAFSSAPSTPKNGDVRPHKLVQSSAPHPPQPPSMAPFVPPQLPAGTLNYPELAKEFLRPYMPYMPRIASQAKPHVTLTWATSLDSRVALAPGVQTAISGPETKSMTHYLRSQHDAILIGVKTALSDDPGLNCRLAGAGGFGGPEGAMQPRPIIIDPHGRLHIHSNMRLLQAQAEGRALGPWIVVGPSVKLHPQAVTTLKAHKGEFLQINEIHPEFGLDWEAMFSIFHREGVKSIMVEGGGKVLSELLKPRYTHLVDSIIMTIAPTFFGKQGVEVSPDTYYEGQQPLQTRLVNTKWQPMGASDMVLCGQLDRSRFQPRLPGIQEFSRQSGPHSSQALPPPPQSQTPQGLPPLMHSQTPQAQPYQAQSQTPVQRAPSTPSAPFERTHASPNQHHPHTNGTGAAPLPGKSPEFRHYGPPGPSRHA